MVDYRDYVNLPMVALWEIAVFRRQLCPLGLGTASAPSGPLEIAMHEVIGFHLDGLRDDGRQVPRHLAENVLKYLDQHGLRQLAARANQHLPSFVSKNEDRHINTLRADYCVESHAVDLAINASRKPPVYTR